MKTTNEKAAAQTTADPKSSGAIIVSNAEFVATVHGPLSADERYWVTAFKVSPPDAENAEWKGSAVAVVSDYTDCNAYVSTAVLKPFDGLYKKRKANFSRLRLVVLDDSITDDCSYLLETSAGNYQAGFILAEEITDEAVATRLQKALGKQGLVKADTSGYSAVRYVRLPCGINNKKTPAWKCRITDWNPDLRYKLDEFCARFGLDYAAIIGTTERASAPSGEWDGGDAERQTDAELIRLIVSAESFHGPLLTMTARYIKRGMTPAQVIETVQGFMAAADDGSDRFKSRLRDIPRYVKGAAEKFKPDDVDGLPFGSEQALADALAQRATGVLRWTPGLDWMVNKGTHWERDALLHRFTVAREVCRDAAADAGKLASRICSASTASSILNLARSAHGVVTAVEEWDKHTMILNTPVDAIDLTTGQAVSRDGLLFTQVAGVAPEKMATPIWDKFIHEVFGGDLEMVEFMQRMGGYCLSGSVIEQKLFFLHGAGANGKSVFLEVLRALCGKYGHNLPSEALMTSRNEGHATTYAALHSKRLAISSEIEESAHWAESKIKSLTGDKTMTARFMRQDGFEFNITHKHLIAGNFKPRLKGDDQAIVRRMVLIPFAQTFEGSRRDNQLPEKLAAEYGGILSWFIEGARKWAATGLAIPASVSTASRDYMAENNDLDLWMAECCLQGQKESSTSGTLYQSFSQWKKQNGEFAPSSKSFSQRLERTHTKRKTKNGMVFNGLCVVNDFAYVAQDPTIPGNELDDFLA
jgi:P4 family phage/plasmid primase-like protien